MDYSQPPPIPNIVMGSTSYPSMIGPNSGVMMPTVRFPFHSVIQPPPKPLDSFAAAASASTAPTGLYDGSSPSMRSCGFNIDPVKKKRGRPRKYAGDGNNIALGLSPTPVSSSVLNHGGDSSGTPSTEPPGKKSRGRPPGSVKKQLDALGTAGIWFTPHVIMVKVGEDIASKIMAFSQQAPRTVCILSANGAICNVTLRQPAAGGVVKYEGCFEIISLSGSFLSENNGSLSTTSVLSVCLAGSDGRVLGGGVAGMLMAATPVQVILGSFTEDGKKSNSNVTKSGPSSAPPSNMLNFNAQVAAGSSPSQGPSSESSDDHGISSLNRGSGLYINNASQPFHSMQMYQRWPGQTPQ